MRLGSWLRSLRGRLSSEAGGACRIAASELALRRIRQTRISCSAITTWFAATPTWRRRSSTWPPSRRLPTAFPVNSPNSLAPPPTPPENDADLPDPEPVPLDKLTGTWTSKRDDGSTVTLDFVINYGANIDIVAVVTDADPDFNIRRMERYFMLIGRSGAKAVVLVNKSDLWPIEQSNAAAAEIAALWDGASVHVTSAVSGQGLKDLKKYAKKGVTMCIVGSSGVGKSTLVNQLYGEEWQWTSASS
jgi:GTP-binding protein EngB required for normal cell division